MNKLIVLCLLGLFMGAPAFAADASDTLKGGGTQRVAISGGDSPLTFSVTVSSAEIGQAATLVKAARTDRSRRRIRFQNMGNVTVRIGSSTVAASDLFILGESTNTAIPSWYDTYSSGAFYAVALASAASQNVRVIEETQSVP